jgi:heat shock protein HslJ
VRRASILAVAALLLLAGCGGEDDGETKVSETDIEGVWRATALSAGARPSPTLPGTEVTAEFAADGELSGSAGCNSYGGGYETEGSSISIGALRATKMACVDPGVMEQETNFLTALPQATEFQIEAGELVLLNGTGKVVARFETGG